MGTRSLTIFIDRRVAEPTGKQKKGKVTDKEIVVMYRQYDGYPDGHGLELAEFLADGKCVNGYGMSEEKQFNGSGCMTAQVVAHFKQGVGGFYLHSAGTRDCWEEYTYKVIFDNSKMEIVIECEQEGFKGSPKEFIAKYGKVSV